MKTLDEVKGRCRIEGDCWIWTGALSDGVPRIFVPGNDGKMRSTPGRRAVWMMNAGKAVPNGWRVFGLCDEKLCLNPAHMICEHPRRRGAKVAAAGTLKGQVKRILANRANGRSRAKYSADLVTTVLSSDKSGAQIARELGVSHQWVSKVRRGQVLGSMPVGGLFSGLLSAGAQA